MNVKHYLVTRFNLRIESWRTTRDGQETLTDKWLHDRFHLFEKFCLPSVKGQSDQDFTWCIFFDTDTPPFFRSMADKIAADYTNIQVFYISGGSALIPVLKKFIKNHLGTQSPFVITSRLDNDDLLHRDYVKIVKSLFVPINKTVIDLRAGLQLCIVKEHAELRAVSNCFNPFISLVERADQAETVLSKMHVDWRHSENVIAYDRKPLWIELIHSSNKLNDVYVTKRKQFPIDFSDFGSIVLPVKFENYWKIVAFNFRLWRKRKRRQLLKRTLYFK